MRYAVLIYDRRGLLDSLSATEQEELLDRYVALTRAPGVAESACLEPVDRARTVRVENGETLVTDGPFADTKEVFGGFYVIEAAGREEAVRFAVTAPAAQMGGSVEIRPLVDFHGEE